MTSERPSLETLLSHQEWVRALAHRLVSDPGHADDVAQATMVAAVTRAPAGLRQVQGWLARVTHNAARAFARTERRRQRREQEVARRTVAATSATDPAVTLQRAAAHKRVVDTLFTLPEPYHTVVLLRFFEDIDAREIAARLGRPLATVRTQLQRGLERMRERLDGEFGGDRGAWCTALAPLLAGRGAAVGVPLAVTLGALTMGKWIALTVGLLLAVFFGLQQSAPVAAPMVTTAVPAPILSTAPPPAPGEGAAREPVAATVPTDAPTAAPVALPPHLRGRLVSPEGAPVANTAVAWARASQPRREGNRLVVGSLSVDLDQEGNRRLQETAAGRQELAQGFGGAADAVLALLSGQPVDRPRTTTDGFGRFELATHGPGQLVLEAADLLLYGSGQLREEADPVHVVGPAVQVAGVVRDERGVGLDRVYVALGFEVASLPGIGPRLRGASPYRSWNAMTDASGHFSLGFVPAQVSLQVTANKRGYRALSTATAAIRGLVEWTLRDEPQTNPTLSGTVRHADGRQAPGARIDFGQDGGVADELGRFSFALTYWSDETSLTAWAEGTEPCVMDGLGVRLRQDATAGGDLQLQLGAKAKVIAGRVLAADGAPLKGLRLAVVEARSVGSTDQLLENLIGGQRDVTSDSAGRFELRGLSTRDYRVRAIDPRSLLVLESPPVAAGTIDLELRAPVDAFFDRREGIVVDHHGVPVVGAKVSLSAVLHRVARQTKSLSRRDGVLTGADGRFVLERCPRLGSQLTIAGEDVVFTTLDLSTDGEPLRVVVARVLKFRLALVGGGAAAEAFEVRDANGQVLLTTERGPGVQSVHRRVPVRASGRLYEVDERAAMVVLFASGRELRQLPLVLRVGDVTDVGY